MIKRNLVVLGLASLLGACGFQLRGTGDNHFALQELNVVAQDAYGDTARQVRQVLANGGVKVHSGAPYSLLLAREEQRQRTIGYTTTARTAEYQLTLSLDYQLLGQGNLPLGGNRVEVQKFYSQDENNLIGSSQEAAQLREEMRHELVEQLALRLQLITPQQLEQLQQDAEAKARAEAEALEAARRARAAEPQQSPLQLPIQ